MRRRTRVLAVTSPLGQGTEVDLHPKGPGKPLEGFGEGCGNESAGKDPLRGAALRLSEQAVRVQRSGQAESLVGTGGLVSCLGRAGTASPLLLWVLELLGTATQEGGRPSSEQRS